VVDGVHAGGMDGKTGGSNKNKKCHQGTVATVAAATTLLRGASQ
jgi:hypothetical protein